MKPLQLAHVGENLLSLDGGEGEVDQQRSEVVPGTPGTGIQVSGHFG